MRTLALTAAAVLALAGCTVPTEADPNVGAAAEETTGKAKTAAKPPAPKVVLREKGTGIKSSKTFTVKGDWDLEYTFDCRDTYGNMGNFQVWNDLEGITDIYVNELGAKGKDVTHQHSGGKYALKVNSQCKWSIKVVDV